MMLGGCCRYKYVDENTYSGIVKVPADHENKNGIISLQVDNENRKAILYVHKSNDNFSPGDIVHFRIAKVKDVLVARDLKGMNSHKTRIFDNSNLIELHNGVHHSDNTVHTIRHIINGRWEQKDVLGSDNRIYNIGNFHEKNIPDSIFKYAVTPDIDMNTLWKNGQAVDLYFNVSGSIWINNEEIKVVNKVAILHSDLPH